ncbi:signal peptide peptidase SppA [Rubinisphaera italica]|uniref:Putative signal peptide peptidase SppA n=1 Tax=Rubinisphaera italica TaxID=2527969 RepID=A0A5C5XFP5_9PLAN|nr:signal peptide peptidase SppA [Rubinisphaera italica]TWT61469.1 putative signal peptide peptidase SppA [Rubinisphaera italica]
MADEKPDPQKTTSSLTTGNGEQVVRLVIEAQSTSKSRWGTKLLGLLLLFSIILNLMLLSSYGDYFNEFDGPLERYHSGSKDAEQKIALIRVGTTIMPPYTERILEQIKKATEDDSIKGMVLVVDSPGGLVADSHQIYHRLSQFAETKPIYVQMQRLAASGGYYIAMGGGDKGKLFAEPTTWTGSIGVIIPHYDITQLADKVGVQSEPLKTGEFKDSLSMFKPISERDREVWDGILDEAYQKFLGVIENGRPEMTRQQIEDIATGRIFTADQAIANGMVDEISFLDDTIAKMETDLKAGPMRVIEYEYPPTLTDVLLGSASASAENEMSLLKQLLGSPAPRAFYLLGGSQ